MRPAIVSGRLMFSAAVSVGSRLNVWKMKPILSRRNCVSARSLSVVISWPSIQTLPAVGWSSPARMCISVDLPEPDGPMIAVYAPRCRSMSTRSSARTSASPWP